MYIQRMLQGLGSEPIVFVGRIILADFIVHCAYAHVYVFHVLMWHNMASTDVFGHDFHLQQHCSNQCI